MESTLTMRRNRQSLRFVLLTGHLEIANDGMDVKENRLFTSNMGDEGRNGCNGCNGCSCTSACICCDEKRRTSLKSFREQRNVM